MVKVALVSTSVKEYPDGSPTGCFCPELVHPYYEFKKAGYEVVFANISGTVTMDPSSLGDPFYDDECKKFIEEEKVEFQGELVQKLKAEELDAILFAGGFGVMWDFANEKGAAAHELIKAMYEAKKPVAAVCHGPIVYSKVVLSDGSALVKDKEITGFTNEEETMMGKMEVVSKPSGPGSCEDVLGKELGGKFKAGPAWGENVVIDGNLLSGQNPASARALAAAVVKALA